MIIRITATPRKERRIYRPCLIGKELRLADNTRAPNGFYFHLVYTGIIIHTVGQSYASVTWTYSVAPRSAYHWADDRRLPTFEEQLTEFEFQTPNYNFRVKVTPTLAHMPL